VLSAQFKCAVEPHIKQQHSRGWQCYSRIVADADWCHTVCSWLSSWAADAGPEPLRCVYFVAIYGGDMAVAAVMFVALSCLYLVSIKHVPRGLLG
jgi:hypothetical protein